MKTQFKISTKNRQKLEQTFEKCTLTLRKTFVLTLRKTKVLRNVKTKLGTIRLKYAEMQEEHLHFRKKQI